MPIAATPKPANGFLPRSARRMSGRLFHTGGCPALDSAAGNNSTPVVTEIYLAELLVTVQCTPTGIAVFNGSDVTDSVKCALFDEGGTMIAATADTQCANADTYQRHPFTVGADGSTAFLYGTTLLPGSYYIGCIYDGTTSRYNTHAVGSFGAGKLTGHVYATAFVTTGKSVTPPITFTTALGPIASLY